MVEKRQGGIKEGRDGGMEGGRDEWISKVNARALGVDERERWRGTHTNKSRVSLGEADAA